MTRKIPPLPFPEGPLMSLTLFCFFFVCLFGVLLLGFFFFLICFQGGFLGEKFLKMEASSKPPQPQPNPPLCFLLLKKKKKDKKKKKPSPIVCTQALPPGKLV